VQLVATHIDVMESWCRYCGSGNIDETRDWLGFAPSAAPQRVACA